MNAATFDSSFFKEEQSSLKGSVRVQKKSNVRAKAVVHDDVYWAERAQNLLSVHVDESLPTVSGNFRTLCGKFGFF